MSLQTNQLTIEHLKEKITEQMKYTYLNQYIEPSIDDYKLRMLRFILQTTLLDEQAQMKYISSTMLVQIAADIHESVPVTNETDETEEERTYRQLSVLAGDYFSGLFYLALSQTENIEFIHTLATTVKDLNELKIKSHYNEVHSEEEFITVEQEIESLLFSRVASYFNIPNFQEMIRSLLFTYKLISEKNKIIHQDLTPFIKKWSKHLKDRTKNSLILQLDNMIENHMSELHKIHDDLSPTSYEKISPLVEQLMAFHHQVAKER